MARIHRRTIQKKDLHDPDNQDGVITHLEPGILECKVKRALGSITMKKASGGDGIPVDLVQILKDDAMKMMHSICQKIWETQQWSQDQKRSVCIPTPKKGNAKECSNYRTIALISHASKVLLKIPEKHLLLLHWLHQSFWPCGSPQTVENSSRDGNTRTPYLLP